MQAELGHYLLILAFLLSVSLAVFPLLGIYLKDNTLTYTAKPLSYLLFICVLGSFFCLVYSFLIDDFTVKYVAGHSNSLLPTQYKVSAVWGGHEGSLLLWVLVLTGWLFAVAVRAQHLPFLSYVKVLSVMGWIAVGFVSFLLFTSNPFDRILPHFPVDGADLNPLLQDFGLIIHPPLLYMGYVGFAVSFAFAISALIEGEWNSIWARWVRTWTIAAWACLTVGIALGSWWAYYELGWGGWWFWDPVENASFMPWLSGTALIHSLAVTDKRDSFRGWTLALSLTTFSLSLLGTFLVRSGIITSVHSFASDPQRGAFILIFMGIVIGASILLFIFRSGKITQIAKFSLFSKDAFLLLNNILLITATFIVFFGTLYPLLAEAFGRKMSIGPPYFNMMFPVAMYPLIILMGIGPLLNWKKHDWSKIKFLLIKLAAIAFVFALATTFIAGEFNLWIFSGLYLSIWVAASSGFFMFKSNKNNARLAQDLSRKNATNWGMFIAHLGIAITLAGIVVTSIYSVEKDMRIEVGDKVEVGGYQFELLKSEWVEGPNYYASKVHFSVSNDTNSLGILIPEKRHYMAGKQVMTEASIDPGFWRDVYISLGEPLDDARQVWAVRIYVKPMIRWIWLGAIFMAVGGIISTLDRRYKRSKTSRTSSDSLDSSDDKLEVVTQ
jgi:cytochrome c-type biogenesis protein CcmF